MIFLILKIFVYLVVALLMGGAAGFLLRHLTAQKETEALQRQLQDAKAKVPQLESLLRARDDRLKQLSRKHDEQADTIKGSRVQDEQHARVLREKDMELQRLRNRIDSLQSGPDGLIDGELLAAASASAASEVAAAKEALDTLDSDVDDLLQSVDDLMQDGEPADKSDQTSAAEALANAQAQEASQGASGEPAAESDDATAAHEREEADSALIAELHGEIERLKEELATTAIQLEVAQDNGALEQELNELRTRLRQKAEDYDRLQKELERERRKVVELERERELQNKSLKVLHQQLEMVRESRS